MNSFATSEVIFDTLINQFQRKMNRDQNIFIWSFSKKKNLKKDYFIATVQRNVQNIKTRPDGVEKAAQIDPAS